MEGSTMRFWKRDVTGKRRETGVLYFGESKRHGDAWVAHGYGTNDYEYGKDAESYCWDELTIRCIDRRHANPRRLLRKTAYIKHVGPEAES